MTHTHTHEKAGLAMGLGSEPFSGVDMPEDVRAWFERQVDGLTEGILDATERIRIEKKSIRMQLAERRRILQILKVTK